MGSGEKEDVKNRGRPRREKMKEREKDDKTGSRRRDGQRERESKRERNGKEREGGEGGKEREGGREGYTPSPSLSYSGTHNTIQHTEELQKNRNTYTKECLGNTQKNGILIPQKNGIFNTQENIIFKCN